MLTSIPSLYGAWSYDILTNVMISESVDTDAGGGTPLHGCTYNNKANMCNTYNGNYKTHKIYDIKVKSYYNLNDNTELDRASNMDVFENKLYCFENHSSYDKDLDSYNFTTNSWYLARTDIGNYYRSTTQARTISTHVYSPARLYSNGYSDDADMQAYHPLSNSLYNKGWLTNGDGDYIFGSAVTVLRSKLHYFGADSNDIDWFPYTLFVYDPKIQTTTHKTIPFFSRGLGGTSAKDNYAYIHAPNNNEYLTYRYDYNTNTYSSLPDNLCPNNNSTSGMRGYNVTAS